MLPSMRSVLTTVARRSLLIAVAASALLPAAASAALSVTLAGGDALEERAMTFIATGTTNATNEIYATFRPIGGVPCAPSYGADSGSSVFFADSSGTQEVLTRGDPGDYVMCAYLQSGSSQPAIETFVLPVRVRPNSAALAIQVAPIGVADVAVPVSLVGTTELGRRLYAKAKPIGAGGCGQSNTADPSSDSFASFESAIGPFSLPRLAGPFSDVGQYRLCAWLQESGSDALAEAAASAVVTIVAPIPLLTGLDMTSSSFAAQPSGGFTTESFRSYSLITYRLVNTDASVRFTVAARRVGRRVGSSCRRLSRTNRNRRRCVRFQPIAGSYTDAGKRGSNSVKFSGRVGGRRLKTGSYRLTASPRTATGRGKSMRRSFRIVRTR